MDGTTVKGADVCKLTGKKRVYLQVSVVYDTVDKAITGAKDYNKAVSDYVRYLTERGG